MIRAYQHLVYGLYRWQTRVWETLAGFNAILLASIFIFFNGLTVVALCEAISRHVFLPPLSKAHVWLIGAFIFAIQYVPLVTFGQYADILERFRSESNRQRRIRTLALVGYAILSYASLICVAIFRTHRLHTQAV
jgi:hypothetical protein